jgi:hypothetical protein
MGKSAAILESWILEMKTHSFPPKETDPRLLEALASLNQIGGAINQLGPSDADSKDVSLQLIVESAIRVVPGSSAVIYTYRQTAPTTRRAPAASACGPSQAGVERFPMRNPTSIFIPIMPSAA